MQSVFEWQGLTAHIRAVQVRRHTSSSINAAVMQAYYYVAGPKTTSILKRCSLALFEERCFFWLDVPFAYSAGLLVDLVPFGKVLYVFLSCTAVSVGRSLSFYVSFLFVLVQLTCFLDVSMECVDMTRSSLAIPVSVIWHQWRARKMSDEDCIKDLVRSRDRAAIGAISASK